MDTAWKTGGSVLTVIEAALFSERIVTRWNELDEDTLSANSLNCFKRDCKSGKTTTMSFCLDMIASYELQWPS